MLGVVAFELIPEALELSPFSLNGVPVSMVMFAAGFLAIHIVERAIAMHNAHEEDYAAHHHSHAAVGLTAGYALIFHSFLDGAAIGAAFQTDHTVGITVAIAVIAHDFTDGFNTFTLTTLYGNARRRALTLLTLDAAAPVAGAAATTLLAIPHTVLSLYLGIFAGFLLYLAISDILPEAHTHRGSGPLTVAATVSGTLLMWLVIGLAS